MNLVSVIIPTKNSAKHIEQCLESISSQTYPNIEIIIVDNHSSDATAEIAARYGTVITGGPERSAQINLGFAHAKGAYVYRIDGDFELEPDVIKACVAAVEQEGADIVAVPNKALGESYWSRVRQLERDTYLDDDLIVAARFWRREAFESVGGVDESLVSCEDYDLHNRMQNKGFTLGRIKPCEIHLGEPDSLLEHTKKSFYYGPSAWRYVRKHPSRGFRQMFPLRPSYVRHRGTLLRNPKEMLGLFILKFTEYGAAGLAICLSGIGFLDRAGRLSSSSIGGLILLLGSLGALISLLPRFGVSHVRFATVVILLGGLFIWVYVGKRFAQIRKEPLSSVLSTVSLCFSPYLFIYAFGNYLSQETWLFAFSFINAIVAAWLVYLANSWSTVGRRAVWVISIISLLFIGFYGAHFAGLLRTNDLIADELIIFDQAIWALSSGDVAGEPLLTSAILGRSIFSEVAAPILLLISPLYKIGMGGPILLLMIQIIFLGIIAVSLYQLGTFQLGNAGAVFIGCAFLFYFITPRLVGRAVYPEIFGITALLIGLIFLERKKYPLYFLCILIAAACGPMVAITVVGLGVLVFFKVDDRWVGMVTLLTGAISTWVLIFIFRPYFGGTSVQLPTLGELTLTEYYLRFLPQPLPRNFILMLLAPLVFTPLLGIYWLLPVLPSFLSSLQNWRITDVGPSEVIITPFLFIAIIYGLGWLGRKWSSNRRENIRTSGAVLVLVSCVFTGSFLNSDLAGSLWDEMIRKGSWSKSTELGSLPVEASIATQSTLALSLAHRSEISILPKVEDADYVVVDLFSLAEEPRLEVHKEVVRKMFINPDYGLIKEQNGLFVFRRGLDVIENIKVLAIAKHSEIDYPSEIILSDTVAYRGYSVDKGEFRDSQPLILTTYWESLKPIQRPYLIFSSYPGQQKFQEAVYGLYPSPMWQPGELIRQRHLINLPPLPEGDDYEFVVGFWFDTGEPALLHPEQLLGGDVVRVANIKVEGNRYQLEKWVDEGGN